MSYETIRLIGDIIARAAFVATRAILGAVFVAVAVTRVEYDVRWNEAGA